MSASDREEEQLLMVAAFHARRLSEMAFYDIALNELLGFANNPLVRKEELSHRRLLAQPIAYQVLALIWKASPYSVGRSDWEGWETDDTVYSLSKRLLAPDDDPDADREKERQKLANYITRVATAAEFFELIRRETGEGNKRLLCGTRRLHLLMYEFARYTLNDEYFRSRYDG